jgi:hypothetical protein
MSNTNNPYYDVHSGSSPNATYQSNVSYLTVPYGARPTLGNFQRGLGPIPPPTFYPSEAYTSTPLLPSLASPLQYPRYGTGLGVSSVNAVSATPYGTVGGVQTVLPTTVAEQQQIVSPVASSSNKVTETASTSINVVSPNGVATTKNISLNIPTVSNEKVTETVSTTQSVGSTPVNVSNVGVSYGSGLTGVSNVGVAYGPGLTGVSNLYTGSGVCANGACGAELNFGLAPPYASPYPALPGFPGVTPPELLPALATFDYPQLNIAPGLVFGVNNGLDGNHCQPALLPGPMNPPLTTFENNLPYILDGSVPWWSNYVSSSPGAVFHDNNPNNPGSVIVGRGPRGEIVVTTIKPSPTGPCYPPVVETITPTVEHCCDCSCEQCTGVSITVGSINESNSPPTNNNSETNYVPEGTINFEMVPISGHPNEDINTTTFGVRFNRNNLGKTLILRRGQTYNFSFKNLLDPSTLSSANLALAQVSKLVFTYDSVGGSSSYDDSTKITKKPLFPELISGIRQGIQTFTITIPNNIVGFKPNEIFTAYYQLSNSENSGGPIVIL